MKAGNNNKILAAIICVLIVFTILSATGFAFLHGEHECRGIHCAVCDRLNDLANASKGLGDGIDAFFTALLISAAFLKALPKLFGKRLSVISLISLKVRMDN
jgi:hypothetical protein